MFLYLILVDFHAILLAVSLMRICICSFMVRSFFEYAVIMRMFWGKKDIRLLRVAFQSRLR
jgi:hypothetical protein